jgi:hypothetical protein
MTLDGVGAGMDRVQHDPKRNVVAHNAFRFTRSNIVVAAARVNAADAALGTPTPQKELCGPLARRQTLAATLPVLPPPTRPPDYR